jgi:hypothetical protein
MADDEANAAEPWGRMNLKQHRCCLDHGLHVRAMHSQEERLPVWKQATHRLESATLTAQWWPSEADVG